MNKRFQTRHARRVYDRPRKKCGETVDIRHIFCDRTNRNGEPCAWVLFFKSTIYPHVIKQSGEIHFHCRFRSFEYPDAIVFKELHRGQAIPLARDLVAEQQPFLSSRCRVYNLPQRDERNILFLEFAFNKKIEADDRCAASCLLACLVYMPNLIGDIYLV